VNALRPDEVPVPSENGIFNFESAKSFFEGLLLPAENVKKQTPKVFREAT
jgi:hypothetical protein